MGALLVLVGGLICFIGGIWFLIMAFSENILWGLACLFLPIVSFIFLILHWDKAGPPFFVQIVGWVFVIAGVIISPDLAAA